MILVDIYVPVLNKSYDFELDENASIAAIVDEVSEMICQKERWPILDNSRKLIISCPRLQKVLLAEQSLLQNGIKTGYRMMLV